MLGRSGSVWGNGGRGFRGWGEGEWENDSGAEMEADSVKEDCCISQ
jgi:hypothetical protein